METERGLVEVKRGSVELSRKARADSEDFACRQSSGGWRTYPLDTFRRISEVRISSASHKYMYATLYLFSVLVCLLLSAYVLLSLLYNVITRDFWRLEAWEEVLEFLIAVCLITEIAVSTSSEGCEQYLQNRWHILDIVVAVVTFIASILIFGGITVPALTVRFVLAPLRVASTAKMVQRAHAHARYVFLDMEEAELRSMRDPRKPSDFLAKSLLTPQLALELRKVFPAQRRSDNWELAFSPAVHGTAMDAFYRQQGGASLIVVQNQEGNIFGGFAQESWRPRHLGFGSPESFVFALRESGDALHSQGPDHKAVQCTEHFNIFWATLEDGGVIQECRSNLFGFDNALLVHDDFSRGTTQASATFGSPQLSEMEDFEIRQFECWQIGDKPSFW